MFVMFTNVEFKEVQSKVINITIYCGTEWHTFTLHFMLWRVSDAIH